MKKYLILISILLISILIAGCGPVELGVKKEIVQAEEPVVEEPIKIGLLMVLTGDVASLGVPVAESVRIAVDEVNTAGGINGRMVELIEEDSRCEPKTASIAAEKLVNVDKVVGIVGAACSSSTLAAIPIAKDKVVMITPTSTNPVVGKSGDHVFRTIGSDSLQGKSAANYAFDLGFENAAVMYINNDYGVALKDVFVEEFESLGGTFTISEAFEQSSADFKTQLAKVKNQEPDAVFVVALPVECGILLKQKAELGLESQFFLSEGCKDPSVIEVAGNAAEGAFLTTPKPNMDENYERFAETYRAKFDRDPEAYTGEGYDAAMILMKAIEESDGSFEGIKSAIAAVTDYPGAAGTITFDENGDVDKPYALFAIEGGEFVEQE